MEFQSFPLRIFRSPCGDLRTVGGKCKIEVGGLLTAQKRHRISIRSSIATDHTRS